MTPLEPPRKRAVAFVDGQNLFHGARQAFDRRYPDFDIRALSARICDDKCWHLEGIRFYTGIPDPGSNPFWHGYWSRKLSAMGRQGIRIYARPLRRRRVQFVDTSGAPNAFWVSEEKGIDVRIAIDVIRLAHHESYDVALLFSQDQDFTEVADEIREIAREQRRWIKIACAYPHAEGKPGRGIEHSDWIPIDGATYHACLDPGDYRSRRR